MDRTKSIRWFVGSAVTLLAALAVALVVTNLSCLHLTHPRDPLSGLSMAPVFWIFAAVMVVGVIGCIRIQSPRLLLILILWLSGNLIAYRLGLLWMGVPGMTGYLTPIAHTFGLPSGLTTGLLSVVILYLFTGSLGLLSWSVATGPEELPLKASCQKCGGHVAFSPHNLGFKIPCPHCQTVLTLRGADETLKMSCFFCRGHVQFAAHALGTKLPCPHCKKDITLVEPKAVLVEDNASVLPS
jgi:Zn finger protein HypA/HybF involved in hydrogenase expression